MSIVKLPVTFIDELETARLFYCPNFLLNLQTFKKSMI